MAVATAAATTTHYTAAAARRARELARQPSQFMLMDLIVNRFVMFVVACLSRALAPQLSQFCSWTKLPTASLFMFMLLDLIVNVFLMFVVACLSRGLSLQLSQDGHYAKLLGASTRASP